MRRAPALLLLLPLLAVRPASAAERALVWLLNDNDLWAFRGTDVDYSNGLEAHLRLPVAPVAGARWLLLGGAVGQAIYTPPNLRESRLDVLRGDRPYAGWLWGSLIADGARGPARLRVELRGGVVGPHALAEQSQRAWHSTNRAPDPKGWAVAQVGDQPDLGVKLSLGVRAIRADLTPVGAGWLAVDLSPEGRCEAGLLRVSCGAGALLRLGVLRAAALSGAAALEAPVEPPLLDLSGERPRELFLFAGASAWRSPRDRLLDGEICGAGGCEPSWVRRVPRGGELQGGVAFTAGGWLASFAYLWRSAELSAPPDAARPQRLGRLAVGRAF